MATNYIGYYRVSTKQQGASGLGLEAQQAAVVHHVNCHGKLIASYTEVESGKKSDRPELMKAIAHAKRNKATLIVAKLDRLSRNVAFLSALMEAKIDFVCADMPTASRLTIHIMVAFAEHEAMVCSQRTKAALAAAKARGTKLGSPVARQTVALARAARSTYAARANATTKAVIKDIQSSGVGTLTGLARALQARGIKTPGGRTTWQPVQVSRLLAA